MIVIFYIYALSTIFSHILTPPFGIIIPIHFITRSLYPFKQSTRTSKMVIKFSRKLHLLGWLVLLRPLSVTCCRVPIQSIG